MSVLSCWRGCIFNSLLLSWGLRQYLFDWIYFSFFFLQDMRLYYLLRIDSNLTTLTCNLIRFSDSFFSSSLRSFMSLLVRESKEEYCNKRNVWYDHSGVVVGVYTHLCCALRRSSDIRRSLSSISTEASDAVSSWTPALLSVCVLGGEVLLVPWSVLGGGADWGSVTCEQIPAAEQLRDEEGYKS